MAAGASEKVAIAKRPVVIEVVQPPVPRHARVQPSNFPLLAGVAVRLTFVPSEKNSVQSPGQAIPGPVTLPGPLTETVSFLVEDDVASASAAGAARKVRDKATAAMTERSVEVCVHTSGIGLARRFAQDR